LSGRKLVMYLGRIVEEALTGKLFVRPNRLHGRRLA